MFYIDAYWWVIVSWHLMLQLGHRDFESWIRKHFLHYLPCVRGIHQWRCIPLKKGQYLARQVPLYCQDPQTPDATAHFHSSVCQRSGSSSQYWIPWKQITYHTSQTERARPQYWNMTNHAKHNMIKCNKICLWVVIDTVRPRQNGRHFADDIFICIFLNENTSISINISLNFVPVGRINNIPALVQIMAWRRLGDKPLSELMMVSLLTHICVTRPRWVKLFVMHLEQVIRDY